MSNIKFVTYEEFGAKGDGIVNDFEAIYKAHEYANENGLTVKANDTKTYRISDTRIDGEVKSIIIRTNVIWGDANILIDDSMLHGHDGTGMLKQHIFKVVSDYEPITVTEGELLDKLAGIGTDTKKVNIDLGYPAMIIPYDEDFRIYRRRGSSYYNGGSPQHEVIVIDKDGNIDPSTPIVFKYDKLTKLMIFRTDMPAITIEGGTVTTKAPKENIYICNDEGALYTKTPYIARGISVTRSHTTVKGVKHYVTNEVTIKENLNSNFMWGGAYYYGFFAASNADSVTFEDCIMSGRRCYRTPKGLTDYNGIMGTYDFTATNINNIRLVGCTQHNFYVRYDEELDELVDAKKGEPGAVLSMDTIEVGGKKTRMFWGLGGTNFCKNMEYINTTISRFDAHAGLCNGKVIGCNINAIAVVGNGDMIVEDTNFISGGKGPVNNSFFYLRDDYGATWNGDILVKNCTVETNEDYFYMANVTWANWDYGYTCHIPNLTIDGLEINAKPETKIDIVSRGAFENEPKLGFDILSSGSENNNKVEAPEYIRVLNNKQGAVYHLIDNPIFENTDTVGIVKD